MKLIHTSDWHIGKKVRGYSMLEDQARVLHRLIQSAARLKPDVFLIAGDFFDQSRPDHASVALANRLLTELAEQPFPVCIIAGNHDSAAQIDYGQAIFSQAQLFLAGTPTAKPQPVTIKDTDIYLLPFAQAGVIKDLYPDEKVTSQADALAVQIKQIKQQWNPHHLHVVMLHDNVAIYGTEAATGGLDSLPLEPLKDFDYVALGHWHKATGRGAIQYSGSPLKYRDTEAANTNGFLEVDLSKDQSLKITRHPVQPVHDLRIVKGTFDEIMQQDQTTGGKGLDDNPLHDYVYLKLTDQKPLNNPDRNLKARYPNCLQIEYPVYLPHGETITPIEDENGKRRDPLVLFRDFYQQVKDHSLSDQQEQIFTTIWKEIDQEQ